MPADQDLSLKEGLPQADESPWMNWLGELCSIPAPARPRIRPLPLMPDGSGRIFYPQKDFDTLGRSSEVPGRNEPLIESQPLRNGSALVEPSVPEYSAPTARVWDKKALPPRPVGDNVVMPSVAEPVILDHREKPLPSLPSASDETPSTRPLEADEPLPPQGLIKTTAMSVPIASDTIPLAEELTSQYWTGNRGRMAKMRKTGIGRALKDLERLYTAVQWDHLSLVVPKPFSLSEWKRQYEAAKAACGAAEKFYAQLDFVRNLALRVRESWHTFESEKAVCDQVIMAISEMNAHRSDSNTKDRIVEQYHRAIEIRELTLNNLHTKVPSQIDLCLAALAAATCEEEWAKTSDIMTLTRNITQIIGNAKTLSDAGFEVLVDVSWCIYFFQELTPYANKETPKLIDGRDFEFHRNNLTNTLLDMKSKLIMVH